MPEEGTQQPQPPKPPVIHTMRDDLARSKTQPTPPPNKKKLSPNGKVEDLRPPHPPNSPANTTPPNNFPKKPFPLPSQPPSKANITPPTKKPFLENGGKLSLPFPKNTASPGPLWKIITIIAIMFATGAIIAAISFFVFNLLSRSSSNQPTTGIAAIIPSQASLVLRYSFSDPAQRNKIQNMWDQTATASTLTSLLNGDPRLLMMEEGLDEIYYVLLPDISQPFLVVQQTDFTHDRLFSHSIPISVAEVDGWYVAHVSDTDQYTGNLDKVPASIDFIASFPISFQSSSNEPAPPITVLLNQDTASQIRRDIAGQGANIQSAEMLTINAFPGDNSTIKIESTLSQVPASPDGLTNQQQLSFLPNDITSAYLGSNFKEDFEYQLGFKTAQRSLSAISSLTKHLTGSYAYYQRVGDDNQADFGLIITIPPSTQDALTLGNTAFEELLPSLLTLAFQNTLTSPPVFQETVYQSVPLRYSNIPNSTQALDYAIIDDQIIVSTSQEGMQKAIQTFQGQSESILTSASFAPMFNSWGRLPAANSLIIGQLLNKDILSILPVQSDASNITYGTAVTSSAIDNRSALQGVIQINLGE